MIWIANRLFRPVIGIRILACLFLLSASVATRSQGTSAREKLLVKKDISSYAGSDLVLTVRELEFPPAAQGEKHRHPGPVVVCVIEGSLEVTLEAQEPKTYDRGQCFTEEPHQLHLSSRNVSKTMPVRLISYILSRKGEALTQPEK
jgi:quercetin dioxygenase-like cupin family protein